MDATPNALLVLDKPGGLTSRAVVDRASRWFPQRTRIGHTGTLDPLATGVLVLCLGTATRLAEHIQQMSKTYQAGLLLGARSDTDDADGTIVPVAGASIPEAARLAACASEFIGAIQQTPPAYSAAKVTGRRAYALARRGEEVSLRARPVHVYGIDIVRYEYPHLELTVHCGKGTYIRSLARDLGERLGCGALVQTLRRTRVGSFSVDDAVTLEDDAETALTHLLPIERAVADLPRLALPDADIARLRHGQAVAVAAIPERIELGKDMAVFDAANRLVALVALDPERKCLRPTKVLRG